MVEPQEKRFPTLDDFKKMEREKAKKAQEKAREEREKLKEEQRRVKEEEKLDKGIYTEEKGPPPSPPDMGSVKMMSKGGAVTSRGQGRVMRKKQTKFY
ncbi:MAG: hypothetical protein EBR82_30005 [Caulobacteraceae bacterium]|nr:hypothetical protein [bacterium]NBW12273.1 hypothetical protein [Caulobacteraceae bacterium]NDC94983.1 hypothetical protein [bacterium]NDD85647.1 hypothetical protein [bacterium]